MSRLPPSSEDDDSANHSSGNEEELAAIVRGLEHRERESHQEEVPLNEHPDNDLREIVIDALGPPVIERVQDTLRKVCPDWSDKNREAVSSLIANGLKDPDKDTDMAISQINRGNSLGIIVPRPDPEDPDAKYAVSEFDNTNHSCTSPGSSSLGSRKSDSNDSVNPSKKSRGNYKCGLCGEKTKKHLCKVPGSVERYLRGDDGRLWKIRPLKTMTDSEYDLSAKRGVEKAIERYRVGSISEQSDLQPKKREKYNCNLCGLAAVNADGSEHTCIFPDGFKLCYGDDDIPMIATPCFEPGDGASSDQARNSDDDDEDEGKKPAAKESPKEKWV